MTNNFSEELKSKYFISVCPDYIQRVVKAKPAVTLDELYAKVLREDVKEYCDASSPLPYGIASRASDTLPNSIVFQINNARDVTQPLRPCAEGDETEFAVSQKNVSHRLLKLILSDGHTEIPAVELTTLPNFKSIPIPGEKVLIKAGAEVKSGVIVMTADNVVLLGGEVAQLKQDFHMLRRRKELGLKTTGTGLEGVPMFQPLEKNNSSGGDKRPQHRERRDNPASGGPAESVVEQRDAGPSDGHGAARGKDRAPPQYQGRGRGRGRGQENSQHHHHHHHHQHHQQDHQPPRGNRGGQGRGRGHQPYEDRNNNNAPHYPQDRPPYGNNRGRGNAPYRNDYYDQNENNYGGNKHYSNYDKRSDEQYHSRQTPNSNNYPRGNYNQHSYNEEPSYNSRGGRGGGRGYHRGGRGRGGNYYEDPNARW